ncbi:MAG: hypothetical protein K6E30_02795, partial [Lachnospiraceae bacterium]|nr:hypothetical protein [Lachnospiraceae bacterium]
STACRPECLHSGQKPRIYEGRARREASLTALMKRPPAAANGGTEQLRIMNNLAQKTVKQRSFLSSEAGKQLYCGRTSSKYSKGTAGTKQISLSIKQIFLKTRFFGHFR